MKHIWNPLCLIFAAIVLAGGRTSSSCKSTKVELMVISTSPHQFQRIFWVPRKMHPSPQNAQPPPASHQGSVVGRPPCGFFLGGKCVVERSRGLRLMRTQGSHVAVDDGYLYASIRKDLRFTLLDIQAVPPPEVSA